MNIVTQTIVENKIFYAMKLFYQAFGGYKIQIFVLTLLGFLSGLFEGIGISAIVPLFAIVLNEKNMSADAISKAIEKFFQMLGIEYNIIFLLIFISVLFFLKSFITFIAKYQSARIQAIYQRNTRNELYRDTLTSSWSYLLKQKIGYLEKVLIYDIESNSELLIEIGNAILLTTSLIVYIIVALNINATITLLTLSCGSILFLLLKPLIYKTRIFSKKLEKTYKLVAHHINENIIGIKNIKALSLENTVAQKGECYFDDLKNAKISISKYNNLAQSFIQPITLVFISIVFAFSTMLTAFHFGSFLVIMYLIQKIFSYIQSIQAKLQSVNQFAPFLQSIIFYRQEITKNQENKKGKKPLHFKNTIAFQHVSFSHQKKDSPLPTLSDIHFIIRKGEIVWLIGPSGAGKTTLVDLFLRLIVPDAGRISIDDMPISEIDIVEWRKNIGYVSQDTFLLNDTILNNILFYDPQITKKDIIEATATAYIYDFIMSLPRQFETIVGERGVMLSGGQKQRIVLARILARKPKILILDEAISSLDDESALAIQKSIEDLRGKVTVLAITHRTSWIKPTDRILALEEGKIIEEGSPEILLQDKDSYYYKIYNLGLKALHI